MEDRRSRMARSTVNASAKKGGAGGQYTWGDKMDVPRDYEPVGIQTGKKVTAAVVEEVPLEKKPSARTLGVKPESETQFPPLAHTLPAKGAQNAASKGVQAQASSPPAGFVAGLRARIRTTAVHLRKAASDSIAEPFTKRAAAARSTVSKARALANNYALIAVGMASWNYQQMKTEGIKSWVLLTMQTAQEHGKSFLEDAKSKSSSLANAARDLSKEKSFQATAASAAGGAVAFGASGGAAGLATGTVVGAALGVVPAVFTLGMSIPIFAAIGATCGLVTGAVAGTTVGAVGGGAAGYGVYAKRDQFASVASQARASVQESADYVRGKAVASAGYVKEKAEVSVAVVRERTAAVKGRFVGSGA